MIFPPPSTTSKSSGLPGWLRSSSRGRRSFNETCVTQPSFGFCQGRAVESWRHGAFCPAREETMKAIHWIVAAAALAYSLPAPATAATSDPEVIIYRFPGVYDDGGPTNNGVATVFHCTNFSGVTENIRIVTRGSDGVL